MRKTIILCLLSGLLNIGICMAIAAIIISRQHGFGRGDLPTFAFWTIPLAIALSVSGRSILSFFDRPRLALRVIYILFISVVVSFCWHYVVAVVLGPGIGMFSFPILYIWIAGMSFQLIFLDRLLTKLQTRRYILIGIQIFPLIVLLSVVGLRATVFAWKYLDRPRGETFLIQSGFQGSFRVVYDEAFGIIPPVEKGRDLMEIPANGILIVRQRFHAGPADQEFYLVDQNGNRTKLTSIAGGEIGDSIGPSIKLDRSGKIIVAAPAGSHSTESTLAISFADFIVQNNSTPNSNQATGDGRLATGITRNNIDSLTFALVDQGRGAIQK